MKTKFYFLLFLTALAFAEITSYSQGYILYVRSNNSDQGFVDTLKYFGYNLEVKTGSMADVLTQEKLDSANAADLIIISRNLATSAHGGTEELATQWNLMTPPMISFSVWMSRNSRWMWLNTAANACEIASPWKIAAGQESNAAFEGVTITDGFLEIFSDTTTGDGLGYLDAGNGVMLATDSIETNIVMARWEANLEFYGETTQYPANTRIMFSVGTSDCGASGGTSAVFNLNDAGITVLLNLISEFVQIESGIEEDALSTSGLSLYPNPVSNILRVDHMSDYTGKAVLSMTDMAGRTVYTETIDLVQGMNNRFILVSKLAKGVYMLSLNYNGKQVVSKVMVE